MKNCLQEKLRILKKSLRLPSPGNLSFYLFFRQSYRSARRRRKIWTSRNRKNEKKKTTEKKTKKKRCQKSRKHVNSSHEKSVKITSGRVRFGYIKSYFFERPSVKALFTAMLFPIMTGFLSEAYMFWLLGHRKPILKPVGQTKAIFPFCVTNCNLALDVSSVIPQEKTKRDQPHKLGQTLVSYKEMAVKFFLGFCNGFFCSNGKEGLGVTQKKKNRMTFYHGESEDSRKGFKNKWNPKENCILVT